MIKITAAERVFLLRDEADILNIPELGKLEIIEIYDYYDQPILFACKNAAGHFYFVVAADEDEQHETWLYVEVSLERLNLIRSGTIDLHDAFAYPERDCVFQVSRQSLVQIRRAFKRKRSSRQSLKSVNPKNSSSDNQKHTPNLPIFQPFQSYKSQFRLPV